MLTRLRQAGLLWLMPLAACGLAILVSLGNWQMSRKAWKEEILERVETQRSSPPVSIGEVLKGGELAAARFRRVTVSGTFLHDREIHVWNPGKRGPAWAVVTPLVLDRPIQVSKGTAPLKAVLIIRGNVPHANKDAATRTLGQPAGAVEIVGRVRLGGSGAFSNAPDIAANEWYEKDVDAMREALAAAATAKPDAISGLSPATIAPVFVEAETAAPGVGAPQPRLDVAHLRNRHFEYALTWYGLAATLVGVFAVFAWSRLRRQPG